MSQPKRPDQLFDLSKLSQSSIRKYQSYFQINCQQQFLHQKIKQHFNNDLKVENNEVIQKFLELKREDKNVGGKQIRARQQRLPS